MSGIYSTKAIAAMIAGCKETEMLAFAIRENGDAVVILPNGGKMVIPLDKLNRQAEVMRVVDEIKETLEDNKLPVKENTLPNGINILPSKARIKKPRSK